MDSESPVRFGFVCVQNAGRSQMSAVFAERERTRRDIEDEVAIVTGGTYPAESVHEVVIETMAELDSDLSDREPREVSTEELESCDVVATMGCSTLELDADVDVRDWDLDDPHGKSVDEVRAIRDEIEERVTGLFEEYFAEAEPTSR